MKKTTKWFRYIGLGLISILILAYLIVFTSFRISRCSSRDEIADASKVMQLQHGPMEYKIIGEGEPILFFHGSGGGYDQVAHMAIEGYQLIAVSRPGYLKTPLPEEWKDIHQVTDAYAELLDSLHIEKVTVGGVSAGGPSAIFFAEDHPERVNNMLLISAISKSRANSKPEYRAPWQDKFFGEDFMAWVGLQYIKLHPELIFDQPNGFLTLDDQKILGSDPEKREMIMEHIKAAYTFHKQRYDGHLNDIAQYANMEDGMIANIQAPTLIIHGNEDNNVAYQYATFADRFLPNSKLYTVDKAGHMAALTHYEEVQEQIKSFLKAQKESETPSI